MAVTDSNMAHKALNTYYLALDRKRLPTTAVKPHAGQRSEEKMSQIYLFSERRCYVCENQQCVHRRPKASGVLNIHSYDYCLASIGALERNGILSRQNLGSECGEGAVGRETKL